MLRFLSLAFVGLFVALAVPAHAQEDGELVRLWHSYRGAERTALEEALRNVAGKHPSQDLKLFAASVAVQIRAGGNLSGTTNRLAAVIRERLRLSKRVRVLIAQTTTSLYEIDLTGFIQRFNQGIAILDGLGIGHDGVDVFGFCQHPDRLGGVQVGLVARGNPVVDSQTAAPCHEIEV